MNTVAFTQNDIQPRQIILIYTTMYSGVAGVLTCEQGSHHIDR